MLAIPTACPFCSCGCGFYLLTEEGRLSGVAASQNHPVSAGQLCARGWSAHEAPLWGDRLREPQLQRNGKREAVSWSEALDHVVLRLGNLLAAGKPVGVLGSSRATNEENYLAGKFARAGLRTNNVGFSYYPVCAPLLAGVEEARGTSVPSLRLQDITSSQAIFLLEGDLAETHPRAASAVLKAVKNGARLITIAYRETQMVRLASLHLTSTPANTAELIDELSRGVAESKQSRSSAPTREDNLRNTETGKLREAAEWIARAERAAFLIPPTCGQGDQPRKVAAALTRLAAVSGHLNKPGSGILPLLARSNARGACDMAVVHDRLPGYEPLDDVRSRKRLEDLWGKKLPPTQGWDAETLLQSAAGLVVVADDPPSVLPMGQRAATALGKVEFLVVLDAFSTTTSRMAHALLPITSFAETEGTVTNAERRVQKLRPATSPPGAARPGWQVLAELCARFDAGTSYQSASDVLAEIGQAAPSYAGIREHLSNGNWSEVLLQGHGVSELQVAPRETVAQPLTSTEHPCLLARDTDLDWGRDPYVSFSPTLSRDHRSQQKAFPAGFVEMGRKDADALGLRTGRQVKLTSIHGEAVVPLAVRQDLQEGLLIVPYGFRDYVANVLGVDSLAAVRVERA